MKNSYFLVNSKNIITENIVKDHKTNLISHIVALKEYLSIPSPSCKEHEAAVYLKNLMIGMDFKEVFIDDVSNVLGYVNSYDETKPTLCLTTHMDTAGHFLQVKQEGTRIYGRGACDAKSPLISMIFAAVQYSNQSLPFNLLVAGVVEEEHSTSKGTRTLLKENKINWIILGEPSNTNGINIAYKGRILLKLNVEDKKTSHSASTRSTCVEKAITWWNTLKESFEKYQSKSLFDSLILNLNMIKGGEYANVTPKSVHLTIDIRVPPALTIQEVVSSIEHMTLAFEKESFIIKFEIIEKIDPVQISHSTDIVQALKRALRKYCTKIVLKKKTGTSDMNIMWSNFQIPVGCYGPGNPKLSHTDNEFVDIKDIDTSIKVYHSAIQEMISIITNNSLK